MRRLKILYSLFFLCCSFGLFSQDILTIKELEELCLKSNRQILQAKEAVSGAEFGKDIAFSSWLPELSAKLNTSFTQRPPPNKALPKHFYTSGLSLTQLLFSTASYYSVKEAESFFQGEKLLLQAVANDTLFLFRRSLLELLLVQEQKGNFSRNVELLQDMVYNEEERMRYGQVTQYDVNQMKVLLAKGKSELDQEKAKEKQSLVEVSLALGANPEELSFSPEILSFEFFLESWPVFSELLKKLGDEEPVSGVFSSEEKESFIKEALVRRPELRFQENQLALLQASLRKVEGAYFPTLSLDMDFASPNLSPGGTTPVSKGIFSQKYYSSATLALKWNIFEGFKTNKESSQMKSRIQQARIRLAEMKDRVRGDVLAKLAATEASFSSYVTSMRGALLAKQGLDQALEQRKLGTITALDLRESIQNLLGAVSEKNQAFFRLMLSYFELLHLQGNDSPLPI